MCAGSIVSVAASHRTRPSTSARARRGPGRGRLFSPTTRNVCPRSTHACCPRISATTCCIGTVFFVGRWEGRETATTVQRCRMVPKFGLGSSLILVGSRNHRSLYPVTLDALISRPTTDSHPGCRISPIRRHSCEPSDGSCVQSQARRLHPSRSNRSRSLPSPSPSRSG